MPMNYVLWSLTFIFIESVILGNAASQNNILVFLAIPVDISLCAVV